MQYMDSYHTVRNSHGYKCWWSFIKLIRTKLSFSTRSQTWLQRKWHFKQTCSCWVSGYKYVVKGSCEEVTSCALLIVKCCCFMWNTLPSPFCNADMAQGCIRTQAKFYIYCMSMLQLDCFLFSNNFLLLCNVDNEVHVQIFWSHWTDC